MPFSQRSHAVAVAAVFLLSAASLVGTNALAQSTPPREMPMAACSIPGVVVSARCGVHLVPENRSAKEGRKIGLRVVVLGASLAPRATDPLVLLAGGPGVGAADLAKQIGSHPLAYRDMVLIDQRGTGGSNPLRCPLGSVVQSVHLLDSIFPESLVQRCLSQVQPLADLTQYTTSIAVEDLNDVLTWLGYDKINLLGGSYGTRVALEFLRRHGERVRTLRLTAALPPTESSVLGEARNAQDALDNLFVLCDRSVECHGAFPNLRREFEDIVKNVTAAPLPVKVSFPGANRDLRIGRTGFAISVQHALYGPLARWLPLLIHQAYMSKDLSWFAEYFVSLGLSEFEGMSMGLHLSIQCSEDVPTASADAIAAATAGTFMGDALYKQMLDACALWPKATTPSDFHLAVRSEVPTLIETGFHDPITPARYAKMINRTLPNSLVVIWPFGGHGGRGTPTDYQCGATLDRSLFQKASVVGVDTSCVEHSSPFAFPVSGQPPKDIMMPGR